METTNTDYSAVAPPVVKDERFARLNQLVKDSEQQEALLTRLGAELKIAQEKLRDLTWREIPTLMDEIGLKEFKTLDDVTVAIKEEIEAGISEERRGPAHGWLDDNGHSGLVKRNIVVSFNKDQTEAAQALLKELRPKYAAVTEDTKVHPSTLKAWVREMLEKGVNIPQETFGVFRHRVAKITAAKVVKKRK